MDTAAANNRGTDKAMEWLQRLNAQDVMTVGDLRDLHDADWSSLGLTVFASRALRNALVGKGTRNISPKGGVSKMNLPAALSGQVGGAGVSSAGTEQQQQQQRAASEDEA